jgi:hypothetical protein
LWLLDWFSFLINSPYWILKYFTVSRHHFFLGYFWRDAPPSEAEVKADFLSRAAV